MLWRVAGVAYCDIEATARADNVSDDSGHVMETRQPLTLDRLSSHDCEEERLVAELEQLGIHYLSRCTTTQARHVRPPDALLADLVQQASARVRNAVIAVLLIRPDYAEAMPLALARLQPHEQLTLRIFYTAAALLQQVYGAQLLQLVNGQLLPDRFAASLDLPTTASARERLAALGRRHRQATGRAVNWVGTYENVVRCLLRSWELEARWNR